MVLATETYIDWAARWADQYRETHQKDIDWQELMVEFPDLLDSDADAYKQRYSIVQYRTTNNIEQNVVFNPKQPKKKKRRR